MLTDHDIKELADAVVATLRKDPALKMTSEEEVRGAVRAVLRAVETEERAIEAEAEKTLRAHGSAILKEGADFAKMLENAKRIIAKKKGFPL